MTSSENTFNRSIRLVEKGSIEKTISGLANQSGQAIYFCNVHMLMLSQEDQDLADAMDDTSWIFADGVPVAWLQSRQSGKNARVVRGYEVMLEICERAARVGEKVGLMGSTKTVMEALVNRLADQFEGIEIAYQYCPPFMADILVSTPEELQAIKNSQIKWLFVGLGCPKQEKWIAKYKGGLECNILGVGAAFDWVSGCERMPPKWMENSGLGWFYRLLKRPLKLWRRYLVYNSKFLLKVIKMPFWRKG